MTSLIRLALTILYIFVAVSGSVASESVKLNRITVPRPIAVLMQTHLREVFSRGWAEITPGDLYHAHLLLTPASDQFATFASADKLFSYQAAILYHSDEQLRRWRLDDGDLPIDERRPRSIIGNPDGSIQAAKNLVRDRLAALPHYEFGGTIHSAELAEALPSVFAKRRDLGVATPRGQCVVDLIINIYTSDISVEDNLTLTMECYDREPQPASE